MFTNPFCKINGAADVQHRVTLIGEDINEETAHIVSCATDCLLVLLRMKNK